MSGSGPINPRATRTASRQLAGRNPRGRGAEGWFLETRVPGTRTITKVRIEKLPFRIGRSSSVDFTIASRAISGEHAELFWDSRTEELRVQDLGSTNGTFVNNQRVSLALLTPGDILHIADVEFRVGCEQAAENGPGHPPGRNTVPLQSGEHLPHNFVKGAIKIVDLIQSEAYVPLFQPILRLVDQAVTAHEALTRGRHPDLPENPSELFKMAADLGLESELSHAFRRKAVRAVADNPAVTTLFLNSHPEESVADLVRDVIALREIAPRLDLVLEVHEKAMMDPKKIRFLKDELARGRVRLAFDDFGAGESRLVQLAEAPPDFLKFDIEFVRNIDSAPESKRHFLRSIVAAAGDLGVMTIAEGIETQAEADACLRIGFSHGQGFLFGRGVAPETL